MIKEGFIRYLITHSGHNLLIPEFEVKEIFNHKEEIKEKTGFNEKDFGITLLRILRYIQIIPAYLTIPYCNEAKEIIGQIDCDDIPFIATALAFNCPIWSDDKHFKLQNKIKILTTKEIMDLKWN